MAVSDEELMAEVRAGDVRQLGALFDRHSAALFRYSMRMTGRRERSEDLVQEIFFRMLRYRETYRDGHLFVTWMFRIARNAYIDQARKGRFEVVGKEVAEPATMPGTELEDRQELELLRRAMVKLPDAQRELLVLARFEQMPYDQIADLLDIEVGTVKTRVHRAIKNLRDVFFDLTGGTHALRTSS